MTENTIETNAPEPPGTRGPTREAQDATRRGRVELGVAILIGVASLLTAWATYQASLADGEFATHNTNAVAETLDANDAYNDANAARAEERDWILSWVSAVANDDASANVLLAAMPPEPYNLAQEWLAENAATLDTAIETGDIVDVGDPFSDEYLAFVDLESVLYTLRGNTLWESSTCSLFEAQVANVRGDTFGEATVLFALSLVVGGLAALLKGRTAQAIVLVTAILSLFIGIGVLVTADDADELRMQKAAEFFTSEEGEPLSQDEAARQAMELCG